MLREEYQIECWEDKAKKAQSAFYWACHHRERASSRPHKGTSDSGDASTKKGCCSSAFTWPHSISQQILASPFWHNQAVKRAHTEEHRMVVGWASATSLRESEESSYQHTRLALLQLGGRGDAVVWCIKVRTGSNINAKRSTSCLCVTGTDAHWSAVCTDWKRASCHGICLYTFWLLHLRKRAGKCGNWPQAIRVNSTEATEQCPDTSAVNAPQTSEIQLESSLQERWKMILADALSQAYLPDISTCEFSQSREKLTTPLQLPWTLSTYNGSSTTPEMIQCYSSFVKQFGMGGQRIFQKYPSVYTFTIASSLSW